MTVMLHGLAEIRTEMGLQETGVQLMVLPTTSFRSMTATPYWCFEEQNTGENPMIWPEYDSQRLPKTIL